MVYVDIDFKTVKTDSDALLATMQKRHTWNLQLKPVRHTWNLQLEPCQYFVKPATRLTNTHLLTAVQIVIQQAADCLSLLTTLCAC